MHEWWIYLCRIVIAVSMGCFVAGWIICAKIQSDAISQPQIAQGEYVHPLPIKRGYTHYITAEQHAMLEIWRPIIMGSWVFGLIGFIALGALDDARRHSDELHEPF
jgi:hypothetical protein